MNSVVILNSLVGMVFVMVGFMMGAILITHKQIRQVTRDQAQNRPHGDMTLEGLRELMGSYKRGLLVLMGVLVVLVVLNRFV